MVTNEKNAWLSFALKLAVTVAFAIVGVIFLSSAFPISPNLCVANQKTQEIRIEIRNYKPGYYESVHEDRPCLNADNTIGSCPYDGTEWRSGSYEWRYADTYSSPDEGWMGRRGDPASSTTGYSYIIREESDTAICDGRDKFKDRDGEITQHNSSDSFYIANS